MNKDYQALLYFKDSSESKAINISIEDYIFRITYDNELLFLPIAESWFYRARRHFRNGAFLCPRFAGTIAVNMLASVT